MRDLLKLQLRPPAHPASSSVIAPCRRGHRVKVQRQLPNPGLKQRPLHGRARRRPHNPSLKQRPLHRRARRRPPNPSLRERLVHDRHQRAVAVERRKQGRRNFTSILKSIGACGSATLECSTSSTSVIGIYPSDQSLLQNAS